jgi:uncharacterized protein DUF3443
MKKITRASITNVSIIGALCLLAACGGGGGGGSDGGNVATPPPDPTNVVPLVVDAGPSVGGQRLGTINLPFVSVTICTPGTNQCQTIDHVLVDTGSTGLRIMSSVLSASVNLPTATSGSDNILECMQFVSGYSWGPVKFADFKLGNQQVASMPIQIIGDPLFSVPPTSCSNLGASLNSVSTLGANGILGVGVFEYDCDSACAQAFPPAVYFSCSGSGCQPTSRSLAQQIPNPVARFSGDNNGVLIELPAVTANGAAALKGSLIFGIGTQSNNSLGNARVLLLNSIGEFTTLYNGDALTRSFIDSGSNGLFFRDNAIPVCGDATNAPGFYCPSSTLTLSAIQQSPIDAGNVPINFNIANTVDLLTNNPTHDAFNNVGGNVPALFFNSFDWGTPFFFGRRVFSAIEGRSTPAGVGPYIAY